MDHHVRLHATTFAIVVVVGVGVSLVTSTAVASRAYRQRGQQVLEQEQTIRVKGSTRQRIRSDKAAWNISVSGRGATLQDAFANLSAGVGRVEASLKDAGFADAEIGLSAIDTSTHYVRDREGHETRAVAEYELSRRFTITTANVDRVSQVAGRVTELIQEGVWVFSSAPEYYFTGLAQLKIDLMAAASGDARARAEKIATSAGCALGPLRDASMGVLQITQPDSTDVSDYGINDTSTIDKDVLAVVTATFGIRSR